MASFPLLSSGAMTQYPLEAGTGQGTQIIRFLDGTDQRFCLHGRLLRRWLIRLELLNDDELHALEAFFRSQQGSYTTFSFPDPLSDTSVPNCRFAADEFVSGLEGTDDSATAFWVLETNG